MSSNKYGPSSLEIITDVINRFKQSLGYDNVSFDLIVKYNQPLLLVQVDTDLGFSLSKTLEINEEYEIIRDEVHDLIQKAKDSLWR